MASASSVGRKAHTKQAGTPTAIAEKDSKSDGPNVLPAEEFTHGGVRKTKFAPKVPARRVKKQTAVKSEIGENAEAQLSGELLKLVKQSQEDAGRRGFGVDKKSAPVRVAFGFGGATAGRTATGFSRFGGTGGGGGGGGGGGSGGLRGADRKPLIDEAIQGKILLDDKTGKPSREYVESLDYSTYYPVTLPLRRPYSGKSELLDEEEFGEGSNNAFDENSIVSAQELGLWTESEEEKILFFQFPSSLPLGKLPVAKAEKASETGSGMSDKAVNGSLNKTAGSSVAKSGSSKGASILEDLPAGYMGKLLVYESGAVKMQFGDILLDAVPGADCIFAQDVAVINSNTKHCCFLGDINKWVVLVPDVDSLLQSTVEIG